MFTITKIIICGQNDTNSVYNKSCIAFSSFCMERYRIFCMHSVHIRFASVCVIDHIDIDVNGLLLTKLNDPSFCEELSSALRDVANLESSKWKYTRISV